MKSGLRITTNAMVLVVLRLVRPMLSMLLVVAISRLLGAEELGRYTLALSLLFVFTEIAPLGLSAWIAREGARDADRLEVRLASATAVVAVLSLALAGAMLAAGWLLQYDATTTAAIGLLSIAILPAALNTLFEGAFVARERMECIALTALVENVVKVSGSLAAIFLGYGLPGVIAVVVLAYFLASVCAVWLLARLGVRVRLGWSQESVEQLRRVAPTFLLTSIFATLTWRVGVFVLGHHRTVEAVGEYGAAWRLLELTLVFPQSLSLALYPQIAAARDDRDRLAWLSSTASRFLAAGALPLAIVIALLAEPVLALLYGAELSGAHTTLAVLIWAVVPYAWVRFNAYVLIAADRQRVDLIFNGLATAANLILNLVLVPIYGALGTAIALVLTMTGHLLIQQVYLSRTLPGRGAMLQLDPAMVAAALALAGSTYFLRQANPWAAAAVGAMAYLAILMAGGFFQRTGISLEAVRSAVSRFVAARTAAARPAEVRR